jgi:hypothetical protein
MFFYSNCCWLCDRKYICLSMYYIDLLHLLPRIEKISGDVLVVVCYHILLLKVIENACGCCSFSSCSSILCVCVCCFSSISMVGFPFFHVHQHVVEQKTCLQGKWLCIVQRTLEYSKRRLFACVGCMCTELPYILCTPWYGFYFPLNILS